MLYSLFDDANIEVVLGFPKYIFAIFSNCLIYKRFNFYQEIFGCRCVDKKEA